MESRENGWKEAVEDYLRASRIAGDAANTVKMKADVVGRLATWATSEGVPLDCFTPPCLRRFLATGNGNEGTRRQYCIMVKHFAKYLKAEEVIETNYIANFKLPKAPKPVLRIPTANELDKLLRSVDRKWSTRSGNSGTLAKKPAERRFYARRDSAILALLIGSTARISEILALELGRVNMDRREIVIERGKGGKHRTVPISPLARPYLDEWLRVRGEGGTRLFVTMDGKPLTYSTFKGTFRRYKQFAELDGFTIHRIRAYGLTELAKQDPIAAQKIAGHASLSTTMRYVQYDEAYIRAQYEAADPLRAVLRPSKSGKK